MKSLEGLKIVYRDNFAESISPARVYRDEGVIEINLKRWFRLPKAYRDYILAHEEGHYVLDTSDESAADEFAFKKLAGKMPGSLRNTAKALIDVLPDATDEQRRRKEAAVIRSLKYDARHNGNPKARAEYIRLTGCDPLPFYRTSKGRLVAVVSAALVIIY
jgi:hypothetical protein